TPKESNPEIEEIEVYSLLVDSYFSFLYGEGRDQFQKPAGSGHSSGPNSGDAAGKCAQYFRRIISR
ncbi:MAG TPA: hypothetical protein DCY84_09475, partial [Firmicutes bacterium]|nr:hypothetical protein [Bacillota bacterium]